MSRPPGVLARPGPARSCCLGGVAACQKLRLTFLLVCWDLLHIQNSPSTEKKKVLNFLFSLSLPLLVTWGTEWPVTGRSAQAPAVWVLPGWAWRLGLFCPVAAVTQPGEQCSPCQGELKVGSWRCPELIFGLRMAEVVTSCTDLFVVNDTLHSCLSEWLLKQLPKFSVWPLEGFQHSLCPVAETVGMCYSLYFFVMGKVDWRLECNCCFGHVMSTVWVRSQFLV